MGLGSASVAWGIIRVVRGRAFRPPNITRVRGGSIWVGTLVREVLVLEESILWANIPGNTLS